MDRPTAKYDHYDDGVVLRLPLDAAQYVRDVMQREWEQAKDYGAKDIAHVLTLAVAR
jgi:hypothetical protein